MKYKLPCKNCKGLVKLSAERYLELWESNKLPLCATNGCNRYGKYLLLDKVENDYYSRQTEAIRSAS
jgi:hypothetical protein